MLTPLGGISADSSILKSCVNKGESAGIRQKIKPCQLADTLFIVNDMVKPLCDDLDSKF